MDFRSKKSQEESEKDGDDDTEAINDTGSNRDKIKSAFETLVFSTSSDQVGEITRGSQSKDQSGINPERSIKIGSIIQSFKEGVLSGVNSGQNSLFDVISGDIKVRLIEFNREA